MKKTLSLVLALVLAATNIEAAFVPNNQERQRGNIEIVCLSDDIDQSVIEEIADTIGGGGRYSEETGEYIPMVCTVTVRKMSPIAANANLAGICSADAMQQGDRYEITVKMDTDDPKACTNKKDYNRSDVHCTMIIRMQWLDRPGWRNAIEWLSGYTIVDKGTIKSGEVKWGVYRNDIKGEKPLSNPKSFGFDPDYDYNDWGPGNIVVGGGLYAVYKIKFKEEPKYSYEVEISPTIID